ncbi:hypothetical protein GCM10023201_52700 [Actinomycetospora corticicola]|uniref:RND superfamily putative drug exporter n=1 Tax=Actinomycetospora corticicola TaxID=663602 RepID=A0A7Y9DXR7_9PSEU|nr:MMPL family transporter [Actinomycetospora corticicola]NYD37467.1 RND superfamily putative drug exporter [Actinomycetospora corticicola]
MTERPEDARRRPWPVRAYATATTRGWWAVLALVVVGVWLAVTQLPSLASVGGDGGVSFVGEDAPAVEAQARALQIFGLPVLTRIAVVQRDPAGLAPDAVDRAVRRALDASRSALAGRPTPPLLFALPLVDGVPASLPAGIAPDSEAEGRAFDAVPAPGTRGPTTVVTYLFTDPTANPYVQQQVARDYAARIDRPDDHLSGVSGLIPFQLEQGNVVNRHLTAVEIASVLAVALVVAVVFRSFAAPLVTLVTAGASYLVADRVVGLAAELSGVSAPGQLQPVLVALTLGVSTDYSILFLSGQRARLRRAEGGPDAARGATEDYLAIVLVAGVTVVAGVAALSAAETSVFRAFGPGLALTVATTLIVSVLLVPALMGLFGRAMFWPGLRRHAPGGPAEPRSRFVELLRRRPGVAPATVVLVVVVLALATVPLVGLRGSVSPMRSLPADNPIRTAWEDAAAGFAPGILSPTQLVLTGPGLADRRAQLVAFQQELLAAPGVAGVIGPGTVDLRRPDAPFSVFTAADGDAARVLVVLDADPVGAQAISDLRELQQRLPTMLAGAGLTGVGVATAGDTAIGLGLVGSARGDLVRVALVVALVDLLLLVLFLRALVAPLYLLLCSALVVGASLGLTTLLFGQSSGLIFFVPFAVGALLASLGSDYAVFGIGDVWAEARSRPLGEALSVAVPRSNTAIGAAGVTLAASFGLVAIVPLDSFRQLAFAMAFGVLLDTFVVRKFLIPAFITWVGPASAWPSHRLRPDRVAPTP